MNAGSAVIAALALLFHAGCGSDLPPEERVRVAAESAAAVMAPDLAARELEPGDPIFIRIFKEESELEVWVQGDETFQLFRTYDICYYSGRLGPKLRQGDRQSPEGFYFVNRGRMNPNSAYHLAFNIGYPNRYDRSHRRTGSAIMVHGDCVSIGCYAMTDAGIDEIYTLADAALNNGQDFFRVHIFPFRMTPENMRRHRDSEWYGFWENLREGYGLFELGRMPPNVEVRDKRYVFDAGM